MKKDNKDRVSTIKDIARVANVSPTTVSLALTGKVTTRVSDATRKRILEIAKELNYSPNLTARALATQRSHCFGLIVPTFANPMYGQFAQEFIDRAKDFNYGIMIYSAEGEEELRNAVGELLSRGVGGLIICASYRNSSLISELKERDIPLVLAVRTVERKLGQALVDYYGVDDHLGSYKALIHLLRMGHTRVGLICGPQETSTGYYRKKGALEALEAFGIKPDKELIKVGKYSRSSGYTESKVLLKQPKRPSAIFAANDIMAIGVLDALNELGLRAPDDVALVGYDDTEAASIPGVDLTTVAHGLKPLARAAVDRLIEKIEGRDQNICEYHLYDPTLIIRKSCGFQAKGGNYKFPLPGEEK